MAHERSLYEARPVAQHIVKSGLFITTGRVADAAARHKDKEDVTHKHPSAERHGCVEDRRLKSTNHGHREGRTLTEDGAPAELLERKAPKTNTREQRRARNFEQGGRQMDSLPSSLDSRRGRSIGNKKAQERVDRRFVKREAGKIEGGTPDAEATERASAFLKCCRSLCEQHCLQTGSRSADNLTIKRHAPVKARRGTDINEEARPCFESAGATNLWYGEALPRLVSRQGNTRQPVASKLRRTRLLSRRLLIRRLLFSVLRESCADHGRNWLHTRRART